jgi:hypothetical protein
LPTIFAENQEEYLVETDNGISSISVNDLNSPHNKSRPRNKFVFPGESIWVAGKEGKDIDIFEQFVHKIYQYKAERFRGVGQKAIIDSLGLSK